MLTHQLTMSKNESKAKLGEHKNHLIETAKEIVAIKKFDIEKIDCIYATFYFFNGGKFSEKEKIYQGLIKEENKKNKTISLHHMINDCSYLVEICF